MHWMIYIILSRVNPRARLGRGGADLIPKGSYVDATSARPSTGSGRAVRRSNCWPGLGEKAHQLRIDSVGMRPQHAVRPAGKLHELDVLDHLRLPPGRGVRGQDAVGV